MADIPEAIARNFTNVYVCQKCNATNRSGSGKPAQCRKCSSLKLRLKKKKRKAAAAA
ncbi:MAG: 50S ribosomal protein L40e [archaeon]